MSSFTLGLYIYAQYIKAHTFYLESFEYSENADSCHGEGAWQLDVNYTLITTNNQ